MSDAERLRRELEKDIDGEGESKKKQNGDAARGRGTESIRRKPHRDSSPLLMLAADRKLKLLDYTSHAFYCCVHEED